MRKLILPISLGLVTLSCFSFATSPKPPNMFGADIKQRCNDVANNLKQTRPIATKKSFYSNFSTLEQAFIPAKNLVLESYLYANVSTEKYIIVASEECQLRINEHLDQLLGSSAMTEFLHATKPLAKTALEKRVHRKYSNFNRIFNNKEYAITKASSKASGVAFRKGVTVKVNDKFNLPGHCAEGLEDKYQKRYLKGNKLVADLSGSNYATLMKRLPEEECRKLAYSQYQGRHSKTNKDNLLTMLKMKAESSVILGYSNYTELMLQSTIIKKASDVDKFLTNLAKAQPKSLAPWDARYIPYVEAEQKKYQKQNPKQSNKEPFLTPDEAHKGLFTLIEDEFGLTVEKLDERSWHKSVSVYMLKQGKANIGKFYLDLYSRPNKYRKNRHRAIRRGVEGVQSPSSALILNLPLDKWQQTHLKSFFHEFGHLLHNLLSTQKYHIVSGIRIENDLVEMPAKWFEWLSFDPKVQRRIFGKIVLAGQSPDTGIAFRLRLYRAAMGLAYYSQNVDAEKLEQINEELSLKYLGHPYPKGASSQYSFSHLATYGPRYYSYIWSEKVARRLLEDFNEERFTGRDFLHSLFAQGGSLPMTEMFSLLYKKPVTLEDIIMWVSYEKSL